MVPIFPEFKPLELADKRSIARMTQPFAPYSDFCFGSLWCWDTDGTCRISSLHGNLVVRFKDYVSDAHSYGFLGDQEVTATARTLLAYSVSEGLPPCLRLIPEVVKAADPRLSSTFAVPEDPANFDYVLDVRAWVALAGKQFAKHRTRIRHCQRTYHLAARPLALTDPRTQAGILALHERWAAGLSACRRDPRHEQAALQRLFLAGAASGMHGCGLYSQDVLRAFSIWEYVSPQRTSIHHFMKADPECADASLQVIHARSQILYRTGCAFANIEQDLGIPGLAAFKQFLRPCHLLRKFVITECARPDAVVSGQRMP